jgi:sugar phosphate isomerase/epimerase
MRIGALCPLNQPEKISQHIAAGFEFIELCQTASLASLPELPPVPLIWQAPPELPAEHPSPEIQQAVLTLWRQHLEQAHQLKAKLMIVQFRRPEALNDKAAFIEQFIRLLNPLTSEARTLGVQLVLRNSPDNREQLQILREIMRGVPGLGLALDVAYAHHGVIKNLTNEYLWDSDLSPRLAHVYVSDTNGQDSALRLPLGSMGSGGPDWPRLAALLRERYNASITVDVGEAASIYLELSRKLWLSWWG